MARKKTAYRKVNHDLARDPAVGEITVSLDMSKWSTRKKNIIIDAVENGLSTCGYKTAFIVDDLLDVYGGGGNVPLMNHTSIVSTENIDPEKRQDCFAHVAATLKIHYAQNDNRYFYSHRYGEQFLDALEKGATPPWVPIGHFDKEQRREFVERYMNPITDAEARQRLVEDVRNGETITLTYAA